MQNSQAISALTAPKQIVLGAELAFDEENHLYTWNGQPVPGVTTILNVISKPALIPWAIGVTRDYWKDQLATGRTDIMAIHKESWNASKRVSKAAADIGTNVHSYAEATFKNLPLPELLTDQAKRGAEAFHKWMDAHSVKIKSSERRVFSREFYFAGTCDFVATIDGELGVGDIKTSAGIYPEMRFQTAAYQQALQEEKSIQFPVRWIVRFDKKTGDFEAQCFREFDLDFQGFKAALTLHRTLQAIKGDKTQEMLAQAKA